MQSSHFALYFLVSSFLARRGFTLDDYSIIDHPQNSFDLVSASEDDWARLPDVNPELIALEDKILHPRQVDTGLFDSYSQPAEDLLNPNLDNTWAILPDSGPDTLGSDNLFAEASPGQTDPYEISSQFGEDGANSDLDMAGCSATNHWGARDQSSVCPTSDLKIPELPTLDQFTGKLIPADERSQGLTNKLTLPDEQNTPGSPYLIDDGQACASGKPFRLCCICDGSFDFTFCQDCLKMSQVGVCYSPHIEVCCSTFGVQQNSPTSSSTNLDRLLSMYDIKKLNLDLRLQDGTIAECCQEIVPPLTPLPSLPP